MVKITIKIYNNHLVKIMREIDDDDDKHKLANKKIIKHIKNGIETMNILENNEKNNDPFQEIKEKLITVAKENGILNMDEFFRLYINEQYENFLPMDDIEIFTLYNKVFIPLGISIDKLQKSANTNFVVIKSSYDYDGLMDNTCKIIIRSPILHTKFTFDGYISSDRLNIYLRTSQIYSRYLFNIKKESKNIINTNYPKINDDFLIKYKN